MINVSFTGSGGSSSTTEVVNEGAPMDPVTSVFFSRFGPRALIGWTDPTKAKYNEGLLTEWDCTIVVRKEGNTAPTTVNDGTIVLTCKDYNKYTCTADTFATNSFVDTVPDHTKVYSYTIFPRSKGGRYDSGGGYKIKATSLTYKTSNVTPHSTALDVSSKYSWDDVAYAVKGKTFANVYTAVMKDFTYGSEYGSKNTAVIDQYYCVTKYCTPKQYTVWNAIGEYQNAPGDIVLWNDSSWYTYMGRDFNSNLDLQLYNTDTMTSIYNSIESDLKKHLIPYGTTNSGTAVYIAPARATHHPGVYIGSDKKILTAERKTPTASKLYSHEFLKCDANYSNTKFQLQVMMVTNTSDASLTDPSDDSTGVIVGIIDPGYSYYPNNKKKDNLSSEILLAFRFADNL